ncbi:hypothetical protein KIL84_013068, partial [Mauremys mutica]
AAERERRGAPRQRRGRAARGRAGGPWKVYRLGGPRPAPRPCRAVAAPPRALLQHVPPQA